MMHTSYTLPFSMGCRRHVLRQSQHRAQIRGLHSAHVPLSRPDVGSQAPQIYLEVRPRRPRHDGAEVLSKVREYGAA